MKVICVDAADRPYTTIDDGFKLIENKVYTVLGEFKGMGRDGKIYIGYELEENKGIFLYAKDRFIPLSDIDETEMVREKKVVEVN